MGKLQRDKEDHPVQVFCRIRPIDDEPCVEQVDRKSIRIRGIRAGAIRESIHQFAEVFPDTASQGTVFSAVAAPLVEEFVGGKNGLLFTYGVTGSGKTFTMRGSDEQPGLLVRSLDALFNTVGHALAPKYCIKSDGQNGFLLQNEADAMVDRQRFDYNEEALCRRQLPPKSSCERESEPTSFRVPCQNHRYAVFMSYYEVYNNYVYDLLQTGSGQSRQLREDSQRSVFVSGLQVTEIRDSQEALDLFQMGQKRRHTGLTDLNAHSSRSHAVFALQLVRVNYDPRYGEIDLEQPGVRTSSLSLVDLAGSERTNRANTAGERLKEASNINRSLMSLRKCIEVLRSNQQSPSRSSQVVPFRDSKLTHLFKNFFEGDGRVSMIVCLKPMASESDEIMHVLKFAEASQEVTTQRVNTLAPPSSSPSECSIEPAERTIPATPASSGYHSALQTPRSSVAPGVTDLKRIREDLRNQLAALEAEEASVHSLMKHMHTDSCSSDQSDWGDVEADVDAGELLAALESQLQAQELALATWSDMDEQLLSGCLRRADARLARLSTSEAEAARLERSRLETRIHQLEVELAEKTQLARQERTDRMRQVESYRVQLRQLRSQSVAREREKVVPQTPKTATKGMVSALSRQFEAKTPARAAMNPRHRRSRSTGGERWLEHVEKNAVPMGTVLTPKLGRRKSTSRPELRDTLEADSYLLHHQEATPTGDVETRLYKGNIIPTAGGGASVIFDDVEELRQCSPLKVDCETPKRKHSRQHQPEEEDHERDHAAAKEEVQWTCQKHRKSRRISEFNSTSASRRRSSLRSGSRNSDDIFDASISPPSHLI